MAQTMRLASFGPVLVVANLPVVYWCIVDPPTRVCSEGGLLSCGCVVVVVVAKRVGM